jgi:hypothetical protein
MTPWLRLPFYCLWFGPRVVQIIILFLLIKRGLYREVPIFTAYTAFSLCKFIVLVVLNYYVIDHAAYFRWYSLGLGISTALRIGIICEIFTHVFAAHAALRNIQTPLFRWTAVSFLIVAFVFAAYTNPSTTDPTWFNVHLLERSANIVLAGLILVLFLFSQYLRLSWSRLVFGIALGLGVLCSLELAFAAIRSQIGTSAHAALDLVDMGTYQCCVLIWLAYVLLPERSPAHVPADVPENDLELWNNEIRNLLRQ